MTEIPEHLLKRSRDRRAAVGSWRGHGCRDPGRLARRARPRPRRPRSAPAAPTARLARGRRRRPAPKRTAARAGPALRRRRQAAGEDPVLGHGRPQPAAGLGLHVRPSLTEAPEVAAGPLGGGAEVYARACSSCHGASGEGGVGRQLGGGEVLVTFPPHRGPAALRVLGHGRLQAGRRRGLRRSESLRWPTPHRLARSDAGPERLGLTDVEILAVVCHERYTDGGADTTSEEFVEEYENWCSEEAPAFLALEEGETLPTLPRGRPDGSRRGGAGDHPHRRRPCRGLAGFGVTRTEVLVVGGGPAGAAGGYWLGAARTRRHRRRAKRSTARRPVATVWRSVR